jgi:tetratricopeptide (TPR) repeat protein
VVLEAGKRVVDRELLDLAASVFHSAIEVSRESRDKARLYRKRGEALLSLAERQPDARFLEEAIESFRTSLSQLSQQESALDWAATQQELASALSLLGDRTGRNEALQQAIDALDAALKVRTRERLPIDWAETQRKRGAALRRLGQRLSDPDTLEKSIAAYRASLQVWTREQAPEEWAKVQTGLGGALCTLGDREQGIARLEEGVKAFTAALEVRTRERFPREWAATQNNLAAALVWLGERQRGDESLQAAVDASRLAMEVWSREQSPYDWARAQGNLGNALLGLGKRLGDGRSLRDAVEAYSAALAVWDEKQAATDWAMAQNNLGRALCALGQVENNTTILEEGIAKYQAALKGCADAPAIADRINDNLRVAIQFRESRKPSVGVAFDEHDGYTAAAAAVGREELEAVMDAVRVSSWNALLKEAHADSFNRALSRYRSPCAFRGMCADWPLSTSLQRLNHPLATLRNIERAMFRNFKKYAYAELDPSTSDWKWLAVAQHHGLPTRLLDWTFSPFVAMHFATNELDKMDTDGVVWMVNFDLIRRLMPSSFQRVLSQHYAMTFSVEMLEDDDDLKQPFVFEQTEGTQNPFVMFFEPPSLDPRIVNQWGLFSFMNSIDLQLDQWLAASDPAVSTSRARSSSAPRPNGRSATSWTA